MTEDQSMNHELRLADIGEGLDEAEIIRWFVAVGDHVERDQPLIEVMTDKSNAELPSPATGVVVSLTGSAGDIVTVGALLAVVGQTEEAQETEGAEEAHGVAGDPNETIAATELIDATTDTSSSAAVASAAAGASGADGSQADEPAITPRPKASPSTRREAAARNIDLEQVVGSGPGGRILLSDLDQPITRTPPSEQPELPDLIAPPEAARPGPDANGLVADSAPPAHNEPEAQSLPEASDSTSVQPPSQLASPADIKAGTVPLRGVRRAVAQNMARSWFDIPHIHAFEHIDAEPLLNFRSRLRASERAEYERVNPLSFFVAAVASALRIHPQANASINMADETITHHRSINVGIAVAAPQGLVVPVLRGADQLDFPTLCVALSELVAGARAGTLSREHFQGGTVTITNFGSLGGEQATPLIRPPEALIVGFGAVAPRPYVVDGAVVARKTMHLVVGADHRLLDGDVTTAILRHVADVLVDPLTLIL